MKIHQYFRIKSLLRLSFSFVLFAAAANGLAAMVASASPDSGTYFRVILSGDGVGYEYRVAPTIVDVALVSSCEGGFNHQCNFVADPAYQADWAQKKKEAVLLSRFRKPPLFSIFSADVQLKRAVLAENDTSGGASKFEVFNLEDGASEMTVTTKRRIAGAEMLGTRGCVLLLTSSFRNGKMPWHWPLALAGHPPQFSTYYLEIYGRDGRMFRELLVRKELMNSAGFLVRHLGSQSPDTTAEMPAPC